MKVVYQSIDGKVFDTANEAIERDAFVELKEHLGEAPNYMPDYTKELLANYLIDLGYIKVRNRKAVLEESIAAKEQEAGLTISFGDGRKDNYV